MSKDIVKDEFEYIYKLEEIIGYEFNDTYLISIALVHPGLSKNDNLVIRRFEKLEFLGDRVLGLSLSGFLYEHFKQETEGDLAVRVAYLAGTECLIDIAKTRGVLNCFSVPKDCYISKNKNSSSIADMMEAVFGAIFLDADFYTVQKIILKLYGDEVFNLKHKAKDFKTQLQEYAQAGKFGLPVYKVLQMSGSSHNPTFDVEVASCNHTVIGHGNSKKLAEHNAAEVLMCLLNEKN